MNKKTIKKIAYFFKALFSGFIGTIIFFLLSIIAFAVVKLIYLIINRDLIVSKYNIILIIALFLIFGFIYGVNCFVKRNHYYKWFTISWFLLLIDLVISAVFSFAIFLYLKYIFLLRMNFASFIFLFLLCFILFYAFSALFLKIYENKPKKTTKSMWFFLILFNPVFVIIYLMLFNFVVYNSIYVPCNVVVVGVDKNAYTANTDGLNIKPGETVNTIDGREINSLQDVKDYMNSLDVTKEVLVETNSKVYYIKTYKKDDGKRYLGLFLEQQICKKDY